MKNKLLKTILIPFVVSMQLTSCARMILGNEISGATREMLALQSDHNGLLFVTGRFAAKNKRWPNSTEELKLFWDNPKNIADQSAYRNLRFVERKNGGVKLTWEDKEGGESSLHLPAIKE